MTHPTREDWMAFLYDESPAASRAELQSHCQSCAECRAQLAVWQGAAREMHAWKLPRRRLKSRAPALTRWAVAAAVAALAIIGGMRLVALSNEVKALRVEVQRSSERDFEAALASVTERAAKSASIEAQTLIAAVVQQWEQKRLADQQATLAALKSLSTRYAQDYAALRNELETVALFSEAGWQRTQSQVSSLAATPVSFSNNQ